MKLKPDPPKADLYDLIGPPDIKSNLPLKKFHIPADETDVEKAYREKREEVLRWSHEYWAQHNTSFFKVILYSFSLTVLFLDQVFPVSW